MRLPALQCCGRERHAGHAACGRAPPVVVAVEMSNGDGCGGFSRYSHAMLIPRRDLDFQLFDVLGLDELLGRPRFADCDRPAVDAVLDAAVRLGDMFAHRP